MKINTINCIVECTIDKHPIDVYTIMALYQNVSYPGGHFYHLNIEKCGQLLLPKNFQYGDYDAIDTILSRQLLTKVHALIESKRKENCKTLCWVLNTIHSIAYSNGNLLLTGECSEFLLKK